MRERLTEAARAQLREGGPMTVVTHTARARLAAALIPLFGADAVVWTRDAADLDTHAAVEVMVWVARTLVAATLPDTSEPQRAECHQRAGDRAAHRLA
jgi:hypothetical protein